GPVGGIAALRVLRNRGRWEPPVRQGLFNVPAVLPGPGLCKRGYQARGPFPVALFFFIGLIGGCAGSTCCSVKIFRYQLLAAAIRAQIRRIHSPHGMFPPRYEGHPVSEEVLFAVMAFLGVFVVTLGPTAVALSMTGLDFVTP